jgi:hypothetical protein
MNLESDKSHINGADRVLFAVFIEIALTCPLEPVTHVESPSA